MIAATKVMKGLNRGIRGMHMGNAKRILAALPFTTFVLLSLLRENERAGLKPGLYKRKPRESRRRVE